MQTLLDYYNIDVAYCSLIHLIDILHHKAHRLKPGIIGLDDDLDGNIIGEKFLENLKETTLSGYYRNGGKGDKKLVYRTSVMKQYPPYPVFEGERYVSLG